MTNYNYSIIYGEKEAIKKGIKEEKIHVEVKEIGDFSENELLNFEEIKKFEMENFKRLKIVEIVGLKIEKHVYEKSGEVKYYYYTLIKEIRGRKNLREVYTKIRTHANEKDVFVKDYEEIIG